MTEPRATAVTIQQEPARATALSLVQATTLVVERASAATLGWAGDTAQQFGVLVAVLMGPAVFCAYAIALWALAGNLGWSDSFMFSAGPLSNWLIWLMLAVLVNSAASILKKHARTDGH